MSALKKDNNTFFYPSLNLSTVLNDYVSLPSQINFLKLRASYAKVRGGGSFVSDYIGATPNNAFPLGYGQQYSSTYGGPTYTYADVYSTGIGYNNTTQASFTNTLVDANVQPDDRTSFEFGVEAKAFNNRVGIEASYYQYTDGPQIFSKSISQTSGYASYVVNGTKTQRTGWDVTINGAVIKSTKGVSWDATLNLGAFTNRGIPWELFFTIEELSSKQAFSIERHIKSMKSTSYIIRLKENELLVHRLKTKFISS